MARLLLWLAGAASIIWPFVGSTFRAPSGALQGSVGLPLAVGLALLLLGWGLGSRWQRFTAWLALALVGQAVALQLIAAGPALRYQHYLPLDALLAGTNWLLILFLALQTLLVLAGLRRHWPAIAKWLRRTFQSWQLVAIALVFLLTSATVSASLPRYLGELILATFVQAVNLANIALVVLAIPRDSLPGLSQGLERLLGAPGAEGSVARAGGIDRFALAAAAWVAGLAAFLNVTSYQRHPHIPDEVIYLFHARYLAAGQLSVPAPLVPEAFSFYLIPTNAAQWYSIFPPGWPALLALGVLSGVPWLANPLLGGLNILLTYALVGQVFGRRTARLVVLLLCASPWFIFMAMNFMAHTFALTCTLITALAAVRARASGRLLWAGVAGGALGLLSLVRPVDAVIVAALIFIWAVASGWRQLRLPAVLTFLLAALAVSALILPYNQQITGSPTRFPLPAYYEEYFGPKANALGFGPERGLGWAIDPYPGHSPRDALVNANLNTFSINVELFGWSTGSLLFVAAFMLIGLRQKRDLFLVAALVVIAAVYSLYWFSGGPDFGARYWYLMLVPLVVLTVRGLQRLASANEEQSPEHRGDVRLLSAALLLSMLALVNFFPWRAIDKYQSFRGMRPDIRALAQSHNFGQSLVLIQGDSADYQSAWTYNPLDLQAGAPLYAWNLSPAVQRQLLDVYGDRPVWFVDGASLSGEGFVVVDGPLPARAVIETGSK